MFSQDLVSLIAPAAISATEAPTVRLEATVQNMLAESVPADALSLEQLALMLEALELKSAGGKKHTASAGRPMCYFADSRAGSSFRSVETTLVVAHIYFCILNSLIVLITLVLFLH